MNNKTKKSQLVFDPKMTRRLLKMNDEIRFCPFCGASIDGDCGCNKNLIIDSKPYRNSDGVMEPDRSVPVFHNNKKFQEAYNQLIEEIKAKKEVEFEQSAIALD